MRPIRTRSRARQLACVAAAALALAALAGCGDQGTAKQHPAAHHATLDKALHDSLPSSVRKSGVLRVGTDASYAPMSFFAPDGHTIIGMEPDLAAELGNVLGVRLEFTNVDFSTVLTKVAGGELDLGISAVTDTPGREKQVDFVNYFTAGTSIVVQSGNPSAILDLKDLCGRAVAVEHGTTQEDLMQRTQANCGTDRIDLKVFSTNSDALVQLRTGRVAAVLNDFPPAAYLVSDPRTRANYQLASTAQYEPGPYGVAVAKDHPALRDAFVGAFQRLVRSGVYAEVLGRWNVTGGALTDITVNRGG